MNETKIIPASPWLGDAVLGIDVEKFRAHLAMLAAREVANVCVKHALDLAEHGDTETAKAFDRTACEYRGIERRAAAAAGVSAD